MQQQANNSAQQEAASLRRAYLLKRATKIGFFGTSLVFAGLALTTIGHYARLYLRDMEEFKARGIAVQTALHSGMHWVQHNSAHTVPLVMIHDFGATSDSFSQLEKQLEKNATMVSFDRPGYGYSEAASTPRHVQNTTMEMHSLLTETQVLNKGVILLGHGYGTWMARLFQLQYPHLVAGLILVDPVHEKFHIKSDAWRNAEAKHRESLANKEILTQFGLMEPLLRWPMYNTSRYFLNHFSNEDKCEQGGGKEPRTERQVMSYQIRKGGFWKAYYLEAANMIASAQQLYEARKSAASQVTVPMLIVRSKHDEQVNRQHFAQVEQEEAQTWLDLQPDTIVYAPNDNHITVLRSPVLKDAIVKWYQQHGFDKKQ